MMQEDVLVKIIIAIKFIKIKHFVSKDAFNIDVWKKIMKDFAIIIKSPYDIFRLDYSKLKT